MSFSDIETERKHWNVRVHVRGLVVRPRKLIDHLSVPHTTFNVTNKAHTEKFIIFVACVFVCL
jgi:hypothetical protein